MLKQYRTKAPILYYLSSARTHVEIPTGTRAVPATSYPNRFWALEWKGMPLNAKAYLKNYGFLISDDEVEEVGHSV